MANYELYQVDGVTPIAIVQPNDATWEQSDLAPFADGVSRVSLTAKVVWRFPRMSDAQYQVFLANRPANGAMNFKTWRQAVGGSPAAYVKCSGKMGVINTGRKAGGEYVGVTITWFRVVTV